MSPAGSDFQATGWKPKLTVEQGIIKTLHWLEPNRWI